LGNGSHTFVEAKRGAGLSNKVTKPSQRCLDYGKLLAAKVKKAID
jgi:hypothetical protein